MIRVHRFVYRALWIGVALIGAAMLLGPSIIALGNHAGWLQTGDGDIVGAWINAAVSGLAGFALLFVGIRRLLRPLKAPANPANAFD